MIALLILGILFQAAGQTGRVTGTVRSAAGVPTAAIRVYAQQAADANSPAPLEGLGQTDSSGRYWLDLPAGRYYIASGSVSTPTYYPGTTNLSQARLVTVTAGGVVEGIDIGGFVPAPSSNNLNLVFSSLTLISQVRSSLSGMVRYPDGTPARGMRVALFSQTGARLSSGAYPSVRTTQTDSAGKFTFSAVVPDNYLLASGFAEAPVFYPNASSDAGAKPIVVTPTTSQNISSLDITVKEPQRAGGVRVSGRITTVDGVPALGTTIRLMPAPSAPSSAASAVSSLDTIHDTHVGADGSFRFANVAEGTHILEVSLSGVIDRKFPMTVRDAPVDGFEFAIPASIWTGRIVLPDGSPAPDAHLFGEAVISTADNPNRVISTLLRISTAGTFASKIESGVFRVFFRYLPDEYEFQSMTAGPTDLLKGNLAVDAKSSITVDARVAPRSDQRSAATVRGTVLDSIAGTPPQSSRIALCCLTTGPADKLSTPLRADGSFEFRNVPPGKYTAVLAPRADEPRAEIVEQAIEVQDLDVGGVQLFSGAEVRPARVSFNSPIAINPTVTLTSASGRLRISARKMSDGAYEVLVPPDQYTITIGNLPEGFSMTPPAPTIVVPRGNAPGGSFAGVVISVTGR